MSFDKRASSESNSPRLEKPFVLSDYPIFIDPVTGKRFREINRAFDFDTNKNFSTYLAPNSNDIRAFVDFDIEKAKENIEDYKDWILAMLEKGFTRTKLMDLFGMHQYRFFKLVEKWKAGAINGTTKRAS